MLAAAYKHQSVMTPRQQLRILRERAGLSFHECARALGRAGPTDYARLEQDRRYDDERYSDLIIEQLSDVFLGKGEPPIKEKEFYALSSSGYVREQLTPSAPPATDVQDVLQHSRLKLLRLELNTALDDAMLSGSHEGLATALKQAIDRTLAVD